MRNILLASSVLAVAAAGAAIAADPPGFMQRVTPERVLQPAWSAYQAVYQDGALPGKTKQLIALSVSAQVPCDYCVLAHTKRAKAAGATDDEIREAIAVAGTVRFWSTMLNGAAYDMQAFQQEIGAATTAAAPR
jgi:AhpD family alkylhydroperoxidase